MPSSSLFPLGVLAKKAQNHPGSPFSCFQICLSVLDLVICNGKYVLYLSWAEAFYSVKYISGYQVRRIRKRPRHFLMLFACIVLDTGNF